MRKSYINLVIAIALSGAMFSCGGGSEAESGDKSTNTETKTNVVQTKEAEPEPEANPLGVGPITEPMTLEEFDQALSTKGEEIFAKNCVACHKMDKRYVGPALGDIMDRRDPAWIMNMILNPEVMVKEDPVAKALLAEYLSPMANQNLTKEQARAVLEYFRSMSQENV